MRIVTCCTSLADVLRQTVRNLWHDGELFRLSTRAAAGSCCSRVAGWFREVHWFWKRYLRRAST